MRFRHVVFMVSALFAFIAVVPAAEAGSQSIEIADTSCGYHFQTYEITRLLSFGWRCTPETEAVAARMNKRGFSSKQYVDAYRIFNDIPRLEPAEVETVAALHLVDINPKIYYMVDKQHRISPMEAYNRIHTKRGRPLVITGFSLAAVGAVLATVGMVRLLGADKYRTTESGDRYDVPRLSEDPLAASFAFIGFTSLSVGIGIGSLGLHKLRLRTGEDILSTMSMYELAKRRTKVHHFTPEDFYYDLYNVPTFKKPNNLKAELHLDFNATGLIATVTF
jgi:hypothetical protein